MNNMLLTQLATRLAPITLSYIGQGPIVDRKSREDTASGEVVTVSQD